ncbi:MAG: flavin reductase family protein, partial [Dehalococcoidia bacterium]|nr:flavin reductase family protein [Dehalococcoidia bacterium]
FSAFIRVTTVPPILVVSIARRGGKKKDTVVNIEATGDFVVNMVDEMLGDAMNLTGANYPHGVDEIKEAGLTAVKSDKVKSPRIAESPISMECKLVQILELGDHPHRNSIIFGEILVMHINDEIMSGGKVDQVKAKIIGRLGDGGIYCRTTDSYNMKRV